ncbi:MAG TPA: archease [Thermodesulfovibrionales bacterium]|nr:archease [Thermodesulfovibrionales bacterium]
MKLFETIDISGDAGIKAYGVTLEDAFVNSAVGMYSLMTDLNGVLEKKDAFVEVESHSLEGLLVSWLNDLIFRFDAYGFIGKRIEIMALDNNRMTARVFGEDFDGARHERRLLVKAATYHQVSIGREDGRWATQIIFDI